MMSAAATTTEDANHHSTRRLSGLIFDGFHESFNPFSSSELGCSSRSDFSAYSVSSSAAGGEDRSVSIFGGAAGSATTHRTGSNSTIEGYLSKHFSSTSLKLGERESISNRRFSGATLFSTDLGDSSRQEDPSARTNKDRSERVSSVWEEEDEDEEYDSEDDDHDNNIRRRDSAIGDFVNARLSTLSNNIDTIGRARLSTKPMNTRIETFTRNIDTIGLNTISALTTWQSNMETIAFGYATMITGKSFGDEKDESRRHQLMLVH